MFVKEWHVIEDMLAFLLLAAALTLDVGFTVPPDCPTQLNITLPGTVAQGKNVSFTFATDVPATMEYSVVTGDGQLIQEKRAADKKPKLAVPKHATGVLMVKAMASAPDCAPLYANATTQVDVPVGTSSGSAPRTISVVPWLLVALSTIVAGVLIWRR